MPSRAEVLSSLYGALRLIRFDPAGLDYFNHSVEGFWRSFFAAVIVAPFFVLFSLARARSGVDGASLALDLTRYALGWAAFPLAMIVIARILNRSRQYARYIIAVNWVAVLQWAMVFAVTAIAAAVGSGGELIHFALLGLLLGYDYFVIRVALDIGPGQAVLVTLIGLLIAVTLDAVVLGLG